MEKSILKKMIDVAAGRTPADLVLKHGKVIDVYGHSIIEGDVAIVDKYIAAIGSYSGTKEIDVQGKYIAPSFIDSHIHIESSYVSPEEFGRLSVPHGTGTIIADPHEIVNVAGLKGLSYMLEAAKRTKLDIKYMVPSCVPATTFETAGASISAKDMIEPLNNSQVLGLGEFMDYPGIIHGESGVLDKILTATNSNKLIDGHSPGLHGKDLSAYVVAGIHTDHECSTVEEMLDRLRMGVYILLRQGTACHDLEALLEGMTVENSRRCLLCSDDRNVETILESGHLEAHLQMCVAHGVDPITAIQMATLNAAECFQLHDRGAVSPGKLASLVILNDLKDFSVSKVFLDGELVAENGVYIPPTEYYPVDSVHGSMGVAGFTTEKLALHLTSSKAHIIELTPGGVVTKKSIAHVSRDNSGNFQFDPTLDICKVAVVERHKKTGNVGLGLLKGYGIKQGAIAQSIAHDSHNIIVTGVNDEDMFFAVETLINQGGGVVLVKDGEVLETVPMPIAGLMSDQKGEWVAERLFSLNRRAFEELHINPQYEPIMTLCFMSLAVIPEIKLTDRGLFDVVAFDYIDVDV